MNNNQTNILRKTNYRLEELLNGKSIRESEIFISHSKTLV